MIILTNGPAAGDYQCNQAPRFLRAVTDPAGGKSILEAPGDQPEENETLHIYRRDDQPFTANVCGRGRFGAVERFTSYSLREDPDTDYAALRDPQAWRDWCGEQAEHGVEPEFAHQPRPNR